MTVFAVCMVVHDCTIVISWCSTEMEYAWCDNLVGFPDTNTIIQLYKHFLHACPL